MIPQASQGLAKRYAVADSPVVSGYPRRFTVAVVGGAALFVGAGLIQTRMLSRIDEMWEAFRGDKDLLPEAPPSKTRVLTTLAATGATLGVGYATSRPLLPSQPYLAGAAYGVYGHVVIVTGSRWLRRVFGLSNPSLLSKRALRALLGSVETGVCFGVIERLAARGGRA
jgi:hypothetical protein